MPVTLISVANTALSSVYLSNTLPDAEQINTRCCNARLHAMEPQPSVLYVGHDVHWHQYHQGAAGIMTWITVANAKLVLVTRLVR